MFSVWKRGEIVRLHLSCVFSPSWDVMRGGTREPWDPSRLSKARGPCFGGHSFAGHAEVPTYWGFLGLLRGQRGGDQSRRSQSMARVVTVTAGALSWWFFCRTLVPLAGAGSGMPANGSSHPAMWFVSVTGLASSRDIWLVLPGPWRQERSPSAS